METTNWIILIVGGLINFGIWVLSRELLNLHRDINRYLGRIEPMLDEIRKKAG